jgi:alkanesulfonate monooxygenase SsuD/methylene tetrahydromethanopterin reductase-like flavin-dependent oxidoreductase (luciferase family)
VHDITPSPPPTQRPIPTWVGGKGGPRLLRLAARYGTGWNVVWRMRSDAYATTRPDIERACEAEGRDPASFRRSLGLYGIIGETEAEARATFERARADFPGNAMAGDTWETWRADTLSGSPEQIRERVQEFESLGIDELVVSPWTLPFTVMDDRHVELFANTLMRTTA